MERLSKAQWGLLGCLMIVLVFVAGSVFVPGTLTGAVKWISSNTLPGRPSALPHLEAGWEDTLVEMVVEHIGVSKIDYQPVVILKEKDGDLLLPIWIGLLEANAISVVLEGVEVLRPLTPDLLHSILDGLGANVDYIVINDLKDSIFYANIGIETDWKRIEIDARPSDAIAIALRVKAPIYVAKTVLDKAGIQPGQEEDKYTVMYLE